MREIIKKIIDSYETQVKSITDLTNEVIQLLETIHLEQEELLVEVQNLLAKEASLRKKDFDRVIKNIRIHRRLREAEVTRIVENFMREEETMIAELRLQLNRENLPGIGDFAVTKENILAHQKTRKKEVSTVLKVFCLEQEELSNVIKKLLSKGNGIRIKDFKDTVKGIQNYWQRNENEVTHIFEQLERARVKVEAEW